MDYTYRSKLTYSLSFPRKRESRGKGNWIPDQVGNDRGGFTLIEIIVAVSIFALITLATVQIMLIVMRAQETITRVQAIQDNARFSLELITKEMRTGINYKVGTVCTLAGSFSEIHFDSTSGKRVYYLDPSGKIYRYTTPNLTGPDIVNTSQCGLVSAGGLFNGFTSDQVFVERLAFILRGQNPASVNPSDGQAVATITMRIRPNLDLQTTIVQRVRDTP